MSALLAAEPKPFGRAALAAFADLFGRASAVVPMRSVAAGLRGSDVIGLRHDVDKDLDAALGFARWEAERGWHASYFLLHTADYWQSGGPRYHDPQPWPDPDAGVLLAALELQALGHEVGLHNNAVAAGLKHGRDAADILSHELACLRDAGLEVIGTAAHGDALCYSKPYGAGGRSALWSNYEMFSDCGAAKLGAPEREIAAGWEEPLLRGRLQPFPLASYGLAYEAFFLPHARLYCDSRGIATTATADGSKDTAAEFGELELLETGQTHVLLHPQWWEL